MKKRDNKELAEILFLQGYKQKEIALKLSISETTVSKWSKAMNWRHKKDNLIMSKESRLSELYQELAEFNRMIKAKEGYKVADSKEADARRKLVTDIKDLETKYNVAETISICKDFVTYLKDLDYDFAVEVMKAAEGFINQTIDKQKWQE